MLYRVWFWFCAALLWSWGEASMVRAAVVLQTVATVDRPVFVTHAGDQRLFIVEQQGVVRIYVPGQGVLAAAFLDLRNRVSYDGEQGLLSIAFHPSYAQNGYFFVNYTDTDGDTIVSRFRVSANANQADAGSEVIFLDIAQPHANHNGGQLQFGPDGYLYVGMGDGGSSNDPDCLAQNPTSLLGKMLRIDVNTSQGGNRYAIPASNPFVGGRDPQNLVRDEVWASGLRNPWRFSFDRQTGDLYIGDVGQGHWEEIDHQVAGSAGGQNYGWNKMEGTHCTFTGCGGPACNSPSLTLPVHEYSHDNGCSVIGGYMYRGSRVPELAGKYVFGDFCSGDVVGLARGTWVKTDLLSVGFGLSSFGEDAEGELYAAVGNDIVKLSSTTPTPGVTLAPALAPEACALLGLCLLALAMRPTVRRGRPAV